MHSNNSSSGKDSYSLLPGAPATTCGTIASSSSMESAMHSNNSSSGKDSYSLLPGAPATTCSTMAAR
jgi:hypothetical protein